MDQRGRVLGRMETLRNREQHYAKDRPDGGRIENEFYSARQNDLLKRYAKVLAHLRLEYKPMII